MSICEFILVSLQNQLESDERATVFFTPYSV